MAVTFPAVLLLIDLYPLRRLTLRPRTLLVRVGEKIPFFIVAGVCAWATIAAQGQSGAVVGLEKISLVARLSNAAAAVFFYLGKTAYPHPLVPFYPMPGGGWQQSFTPELALFLGISVLTVIGIVRYPWVPVLWFSFVVLLLPVLGLVQVGTQFAADRYMYLPLLVPLVVFSEWLMWLCGQARTIAPRWGNVSLATVALVLVAVLGMRTREQIEVWKDSFSLWDHVVAHNPDDARGLYARADLLVAAGRYDEAVRDYDRLIAIESTKRLLHAPMGVYYAERARAHELRGDAVEATKDRVRAAREMGYHPRLGTHPHANMFP